jgi:hypothetical protein
MLVLKRKEGQWVEVTHRSGDVLRLRVYNIAHDYPGRVNLAFDDEPRNFSIQRPERFLRASADDAEAPPES